MRTQIDLILRCTCGLYKVVFSKLGKIEIEHNAVNEDVRLPRPDTHLWWTVMVVAGLQPATSQEITERLIDFGRLLSVSDVSSYLTILRSKGLVKTTESRRGILGGSTWILTDRCAQLAGV